MFFENFIEIDFNNLDHSLKILQLKSKYFYEDSFYLILQTVHQESFQLLMLNLIDQHFYT